MQKIAIRGGHNFQATGAVGIVNEVVEDRKLLASAIKYLKIDGKEVLDVTPGNCDQYADLAYGVNKANAWGAEAFISIHLNKAYNSYAGKIGTETCIYATGGNGEVIGKRIVDNIASLGFINRGVKVRPELYELRKTNMSAVIVEAFFCEAVGDVSTYNAVGYDAIGKKIAEGIVGHEIKIPEPVKPSTPVSDKIYRVQVGAFKNKENADKLVAELKAKGIIATVV